MSDEQDAKPPVPPDPRLTNMLTPDEIEDLRRDKKQAVEAARRYLREHPPVGSDERNR